MDGIEHLQKAFNGVGTLSGRLSVLLWGIFPSYNTFILDFTKEDDSESFWLSCWDKMST